MRLFLLAAMKNNNRKGKFSKSCVKERKHVIVTPT
jgi:hypothetical protein